jgi:hypothetical protein
MARFAIGVMLVLVALGGAQDIRNLAMGRLTLLAESDVNRLDLYDYGLNPAGLWRAVPPRSSGEGEEAPPFSNFLGGDGEVLPEYSSTQVFAPFYGHSVPGDSFDQWAIGQPFPNELTDFMPVPWGELGYSFYPYPSRPSGGYLRSRNSDGATAVQGSWSHGEHNFGNELLAVNTPQASYVQAGSAGAVDYGFDANAFCILVAEGRSSAQVLGPGLGGGLVVPSEAFSWGVNADYYHPFFREASGSWDTIMNGNGFKAGAAMLFEPMDTLKVALRGGFKWTKVAGLTFASSWAGARAGFSPPDVPVVAGLEAAWAGTHTMYSGYNDMLDSLSLAGGVGYRVPVWFIGVEARHTTAGEKLDSLPTKTLALTAGTEVNVGISHIRGGYGRSAQDTLVFKGSATQWVSAGFGLDLSGLQLDLAYNHVVRSDTDKDDIIYLSVRFGE